MAKDRFQAPDYYLIDELLTDEHKLIRDSAREWVKREVSPIIEDACQKAEFPKHLIKGLAEVGLWALYPHRIWWWWPRPDQLRTHNAGA